MKNVFSVAVITLFGITSAASTNGAHFQKQGSSTVINDNGSMTASWQERGLGNTVVVEYKVTSDASAVYACINGGGNHPKAANKETVNSQFNVPAEFTSTENGGIDGSVTFGPVDKGNFNCPPGQTLVLSSVCYSNVVVTDTTNGISTTLLSGSKCRTFVPLS